MEQLKVLVTGVTSSGKSTFAKIIQEALDKKGLNAEVLDDDGTLPLYAKDMFLHDLKVEALRSKGTKIMIETVAVRRNITQEV